MEIRPCHEDEDCKYWPGCYQDTHHTFHPRDRYTTSIERRFRELPANKINICRALHEALHRLPPPPKPTQDVMLEAIHLNLTHIPEAS